MKALLPILKTKLVLLSFVFACTAILANNLIQRDNLFKFSDTKEDIVAQPDKLVIKKRAADKKINLQLQQRFGNPKNASFTATVTSDKPDYAPLSTAIFTGDGFGAHEDVLLKVKNLNQPCNTVTADSSYLPWTVTTDDNGHFETTWTVCNCPGDSLRLRAVGQTSHDTAYLYFSDADQPVSHTNLVITGLSSAGPFCRGSVFTIYFSTKGTQNISNNITYGPNNTFTAQLGNGGGNWPNSPTILGTFVQTGGPTANITGQITATIPLDYNGVGSSHNLRIVASVPDAEGADFGTEILIGNPPNDNYNITGGGALCIETNPGGVPIGLSNSEPSFVLNNTTYYISYQLYRNGVATGAPVLGTGNAISFGNQTLTGTYTVIATNTRTGCTSVITDSETITSTINAPTLTPDPTSETVCSGTNVSAAIGAGSGGGGTTVDHVEYRRLGSIDESWQTYAGGSISTVGATSIEIKAWRTASGPGCTISPTNTVTWTITAQPVGPTLNTKTPSADAICAGTGVSATFNSGSGGCSDDYVVIIDGGAPVAYVPNTTVASFATSSVEIQGRRANCGTGTGCEGTSYVTLASWSIGATSTAPTSANSNATNNTICANEGGTISLTASGGTLATGAVVKWYTASCGGTLAGEGNPLVIAKPVTTTTYFARYEGCNVTTCASVTVTVNAAFTAGAISTTNETICYGGDPAIVGNATAASGGDGNIAYKWQSSENGTFSDAADINSNTSSYDPGPLTTTTSFRRLAHDGTCNTSFVASTGVWTVTVRPQFTSGAISTTNETICYGGDPAVIGNATVASGGDGNITYKWQSSENGTFSDAADINSNTSSYDPGPLTTTTSFRRLAHDGTCNTSFVASTGVWTVTVRPQFTPGAIMTTNETICYGGDPAVIGNATVASGGDGNITYKWQSSENGTFSDAADINSNTSSYDPGPLTTTTSFRRLAHDGTCNTSFVASTGVWTVTVRPQFTPGAISTTNETICYGASATVQIGSATDASGGDGSITYSWRSSEDGFIAVIPGATSSTYTPTGVLTTTTSYRRYAKDGTCNTTPAQSTGEWTVTVRPQFTTGAILTTNQTICYGGDPSVIGNSIAASGGDGNITYKWQSSVNGTFSDAVNIYSNTSSYDPGPLTTTTSFRRLAHDGTCNTSFVASTGTWTVTVRPQFTPGAISTTNETICYGASATVQIGSATDASGGDGTITYSWRSSEDGFIAAIPGATSSTYTPTGVLTTTTSYRRYAKDGTCNTTPTQSTGEWTVTVRPQFTTGAILTTNQTICYGGDPSVIGNSIAASGGDENITYKWQSSVNGTFSDAVNIYSNTSTYDPGPLTATTSFRRLAHDGTCNTSYVASTGVWIVTVRPQFTPGAILTTNQTICAGGDPAVIGNATLASGGAGYITYKWQTSIIGDFSDAADIGSSNMSSYDPPSGLTTTTSYRRLAHDATCNTSFLISTGVWKVTVNPVPTLSGATQQAAVCAGNGAVINLTGLLPGSTNSITYNIDGGASQTATGVVAGGTGNGSFTTVNLVYANDGKKLTITSITITSNTPNCSQSFTQEVTLDVKTPTSVTVAASKNSWTYGCETALLTATAAGEGTLTYVWHHKYTAGGISDEIVGTNSSTYQVPALAGAGVHEYWVVVSTVAGVGCGNATSSPNTVITIIQQPANAAEGQAYYTGPSIAYTANSTSNTATFTLSAFIQNSSTSCGDIATARLSFWYRVAGSGAFTKVPNGTNLPVNYVNPQIPSMGGTAAVIAQLNTGGQTCELFDILVTIGGNYIGQDALALDQVSITKPQPGGTISGGAKLKYTNSVGFVKAARKTDLGFFVNYTVKQGNAQNPKGKVNLTVKSYNDRNGNLTSTIHSYKITSNAIASMNITGNKATFTSKCNISEILSFEPLVTSAIEGNCTMVMELEDLSSCDNNSIDKVGIVVYRNNGGIWYSNNYTALGVTQPEAIYSGCIYVSGSTLAPCSPGTKMDNSITARNPQMETTADVRPFNVKAYPNPTEHQFTLNLEGAGNEKVAIVVYDATGRQVKKIERGDGASAIKFGEDLKVGVYVVEVRQGVNRKTIKLIKQ